MKKGIVTFVILFALAVQAEAVVVDSNSIVKDDIEYYFETDKTVYDLGETVDMLYRVRNIGEESVTFEFAYIQQSRFQVWDADTRIWAWPKWVNPSTSSFTLRMGEFKEFFQDWDMINDNTGVLVVPGSYDVIGALSFRTTHERYVPVSVEIQVVPEPATFFILALGIAGIRARRFKYNKVCKKELP